MITNICNYRCGYCIYTAPEYDVLPKGTLPLGDFRTILKKIHAVRPYGSVNLARHVGPGGLDEAKLSETIAVAMRMLDNVVEINGLPLPQQRNEI